ncbi:MAG: RecX family transcriptional regulator [Coriobacteriales bacterium]|nr:RecX family transcriptional regulator [Actinomycetes bacterium]
MAALVTDIEAPRPSARLRRVWLDGEMWRTTSAAALKALSLAVGDVVEVEPLALQLDAAENDAARERALQLLGYRDRSASEMRSRLAEDGYPDGVVTATVENLERVGLIDDARCAESLARSLVARGYGRRRVSRELESRGLGDEYISAVLDDTLPRDVEAARALTLARRLVRDDTQARTLAARLARKGFDADISFAAARRAVAERDSDHPARDDEPY